ncbi:ATP-grasp domain-containing protein [Tundrisphaera lichenicola]|uniref:ATP-grasp domain-containing protein n=1 Tax=Tundrisphaera lichenicola TaxID=2029860 RepID=UPI003EBED3DA
MGDPWARPNGHPSMVLIFEYVTGGGLAGRDLPESWASEGTAMRLALARDFAAVPGVQVVMPLDARLSTPGGPGVYTWPIRDPGELSFESIAAEADYTVLIAPETDGILAGLARAIERAGGKSLGSSPSAIDLVGDKARLAQHFASREVPSPPTRTLGPGERELPADWTGPIVVKPTMGAGSVDTFVVRDRQCPTWANRDGTAIIQPYLPGEPMSASFLVDLGGRPTLLAIGRQRIAVDEEGRISYQGGIIPERRGRCPEAVEAAITSVANDLESPSLRGFVGVDFLLDGEGHAVILEINPRPTTSYVGLTQLLPPGTIAGAWLDAVSTGLAETDWPDRLRKAHEHPPIRFEADGSARPEGMNA